MHHNHQTIVNLFGGLKPLCLQFDPEFPDHTIATLKNRLHELTSVPPDAQRLTTLGGRFITDDQLIFDPAEPDGPITFNMSLRLPGGKGGFGSMLRAQGGRMASQKTTNYEACRDLSGRRLKTVNEAKKLADLLEKQPEIEKAKRERLQRKIERGLKEPPQKKHRFNDNKFLEDRVEVIEGVKNAVAAVVKKGLGKGKNKMESESEDEGMEEGEAALAGYWDEGMFEEEEEGEDEEDEEDEENEGDNEEKAESEDEEGEEDKAVEGGDTGSTEDESGYSSNNGTNDNAYKDKGKGKESKKRKERV
ncbi:telomere stability and silencing-domain-containing protein [Endogone sp. FLAS-F59071]|nr:telomere stability and silencing-domain-containing protein [Endogone sp. FLAS-F59071]|eukprot:RUS18186.1 telomere stability and silencing-domain-containing protein [Endogone sp. FLAS-F59071]